MDDSLDTKGEKKGESYGEKKAAKKDALAEGQRETLDLIQDRLGRLSTLLKVLNNTDLTLYTQSEFRHYLVTLEELSLELHVDVDELAHLLIKP